MSATPRCVGIYRIIIGRRKGQVSQIDEDRRIPGEPKMWMKFPDGFDPDAFPEVPVPPPPAAPFSNWPLNIGPILRPLVVIFTAFVVVYFLYLLTHFVYSIRYARRASSNT